MANNKNRASEKESFWRLALEEFQGSGLSVRAFCRREGLSEPSFFSWRRTLQERDAAKRDAGCDRAGLIPVDVVEPVDSSPGCEQAPAYLEVITPSGFTLRFHSDIEPRQLGVVLGVIADCHGAAPC